jgi:hypothetical protein
MESAACAGTDEQVTVATTAMTHDHVRSIGESISLKGRNRMIAAVEGSARTIGL